MKTLIITFISAILSTSGCKKSNNTYMNPLPSVPNKPVTNVKTYSYLALGDSYTIGESVPPYHNFPNQLADALRTDSTKVEAPKVIARTGWTSDELISAIKSENLTKKYDFVTLLIGVNNQYRNDDTVIYRKEFRELLQTAIGYANGKQELVFVLSIPDWGVTPYGQSSGRSPAQIAKEIDAYNAIDVEETAKTKAVYVNITPISREAKTNSSLVASDGLHPSAQMYRRWVDLLKPLVKSKLN